ncbi:uncharacterized protein LOC109723823 [Ananas comosus]|uniref:Uncharacterized protein LOC109723823 n=1 Tax=Ananas comosus TaxID=4615 RepID=A0A6P5GIY7_ANACO|nr:uncharacterized protein LOC109723823 [Ananas comosus]
MGCGTTRSPSCPVCAHLPTRLAHGLSAARAAREANHRARLAQPSRGSCGRPARARPASARPSKPACSSRGTLPARPAWPAACTRPTWPARGLHAARKTCTAGVARGLHAARAAYTRSGCGPQGLCDQHAARGPRAASVLPARPARPVA